MGINIHDPLVQIKVTESVCGFVAICMTLVRLRLRWSRYWWDDAWAFFSLLCLFVQIAGVFMHVDKPSDLSKTNRVAAYYLIATTFYAVIWSARLSILFSIIRIYPDPVTRRRLVWLGGLFIAAIVFFFTQLFWICETMHNGWRNKPSPQCPLPKQVAICQLVSDVLADLSLILLPLRLIQGIKERRLRWRLIFIFSTAIVTTVVSLVHAAYIITRGGIPVIISALVEDCMSLTVANLPVVATASLRHFSTTAAREPDPDGDQHWSSWIFRSPTQPGTANMSAQLTTSFRSRGNSGARGGRIVGNTGTMSTTDTTIDLTKKSVIPAFEIGSDEQLFDPSGPEKKTDGEKGDDQDPVTATAVRREDRSVVRIDVLPYPREPPSPLPPTPATGEP